MDNNMTADNAPIDLGDFPDVAPNATPQEEGNVQPQANLSADDILPDDFSSMHSDIEDLIPDNFKGKLESLEDDPNPEGGDGGEAKEDIEEPKDSTKKESNRGNKGIREQLEKVNRERKEVEEQFQKREAELQAEIDAFKSQTSSTLSEREELASKLEKLKEDRDLAEIRGWMGDPKDHPKVKSVEDSFINARDSDWVKTAMAFNNTEEAKKFINDKNMVLGEFSQLYDNLGSPLDEGYFERKEALNEKIEEEFPENADKILSFMPKVSDFWKSRNETIDNLKKDKGEYKYSIEKESYDKKLSALSEYEKRWKDDNYYQSNAESPEAKLRSLISTNEEFKGLPDEAVDHIKKNMITPPLRPDEVAKMTREERQRYNDTSKEIEQRNWENNISELKFAYEAKKALPVLMKQLQEVQERLAEYEEGKPTFQTPPESAITQTLSDNPTRQDLERLADQASNDLVSQMYR